MHLYTIDCLRPLDKSFHDLPHIPVRLALHDDIFPAPQFRGVKVQHVPCLDVRCLPENVHQLRQVGKFIKPCLEPEPAALVDGKLNKVVENVLYEYRKAESEGKVGTQLIFSLRQVGKFIKPCLEPEPAALNSKFQSRCLLPEISRPAVKMVNPKLNHP